MTRRWLRIELRRRWRSLVVLSLLVAVAAGVIITTLAAARRGASALTRLQERTLPATALVLANTPGFDWSKVRTLPEVAALTTFVVDYTIGVEGIDGSALNFPPADPNWLNTVERPVILDGRNLDSNRADEVLVTPKFVRSYHKGVGDTVVIRLPSAKQLAEDDESLTPDQLAGPRITATIVGVALSPWLSDNPAIPGALQMSPAVVHDYPQYTIGPPGADNVQFVNALVRLKHGAADLDRFRTDFNRVTGRSDIEVASMVAQGEEYQRHIAFESRCLVAFALAVFLAALFLVGQAIVRYASSTASELQTMQAMGMTPRQAVVTAAAAPSVVGVIGTLVGAVGAYVASSHFPFGGAAYFEPSPGRQLDVWITVTVAVLVIALVAGAAAGAARLALARRRVGASRRSAIATSLARAGAPIPVVIGARFALESGRGRTAVPVRPALIGSVVGVLGILAAFTFSRGVSDAASNPARFGQTFQLGAFVGINDQDFGPNAKAATVIRGNADVAGFADSRTAVATTLDGHDSVSVWEFQTGAKQLPIVVLSGRLPSRPGEIALGPTTLSTLHTSVGGHARLRGSKPGVVQDYLVTGSTLLPEGPHNNYFDGAWVTGAGYDAIFTGFKFHLDLITLRSGVSVDEAQQALTAALTKAGAGGIMLERPDEPGELTIIKKVEVLPVFLGGFLVLLAIGAVGHALATAVRRRAHDLAVLRALGMTRWQCRWIVVTQASVLALVGLTFGVPIGLAVGRSLWRWVADYTPIQYVPPLALWALALVGPAALIVANLLAAWPGQRASRLRIAHILRAE